MSKPVYRLELDACRAGRHDACQNNTWVHLSCSCPCHADQENSNG